MYSVIENLGEWFRSESGFMKFRYNLGHGRSRDKVKRVSIRPDSTGYEPQVYGTIRKTEITSRGPDADAEDAENQGPAYVFALSGIHSRLSMCRTVFNNYVSTIVIIDIFCKVFGSC